MAPLQDCSATTVITTLHAITMVRNIKFSPHYSLDTVPMVCSFANGKAVKMGTGISLSTVWQLTPDVTETVLWGESVAYGEWWSF